MQTLMDRFITEEDIRISVNAVYIFGDNMKGFGLAGQAKIARQFVMSGKAFGIPTKRAPCTDEECYFADREDEIIAVRRAFAKIRQLKYSGKKIVFFPGIGDGMAELSTRSPAIYGMIRGFVQSMECEA